MLFRSGLISLLVAGSLAGARWGLGAIPERWLGMLHGYVRQPDGSVRMYQPDDLLVITDALLGD